jgi:hypothetical protein
MAAWGLKNNDLTFVRRDLRTTLYKHIARGDAVVEFVWLGWVKGTSFSIFFFFILFIFSLFFLKISFAPRSGNQLAVLILLKHFRKVRLPGQLRPQSLPWGSAAGTLFIGLFSWWPLSLLSV